MFVLGQINYQPLLIAEETAKAHELAATQACRALAVNSPVKCFRSQKNLFDPEQQNAGEKKRTLKLFYLDDGVLRFKCSSPKRRCKHISVPHYTAEELKARK